jgi:hypothetical protein
MDLVQVHVIRLQPLQAVVDLAQDRLARESAAVRSFAHLAMDLGRDNDLVPLCKIFQRAPEDFLTRADGIDVGRIEEIDSHLYRFFDDRPAVLLIEHPFMNPTLGISKPHASETNARDFHPC